MATISFFGATDTVTGSRFFLEAEGKRILIDCGMFQGIRKIPQQNWDPFPVEPGSIDAVLPTHAHTDHSAWLPRLVRNGFCGDVYCTPATHDLCKIMLLDRAHIHQEDARWATQEMILEAQAGVAVVHDGGCRGIIEVFQIGELWSGSGALGATAVQVQGCRAHSRVVDGSCHGDGRPRQ